MSCELVIYQAYIEYFFGSRSGYGTVKSFYGSPFSSKEKCKNDLSRICTGYDIKSWSILQYTLDSGCLPITVEESIN
jgi:hypothetical protein